MAKAKQPVSGWWGQRWLETLGRAACCEQMTAGQIRSAERADAQLAFSKGLITAVVEVGSYGNTQTATLKVKPLGERDWKRVVAAIAQQPETAQRLLNGTPGAELEAVFALAQAELFPLGGARTRCTCPDDWGCRHVRVLFVRSSALLDENPFLWLKVLGRDRQDLLAAVRARLADQAGAASGPAAAMPAAITAERFLETETDPGLIPVRPGQSTVPDGLIKLLGPVPLPEILGKTTHMADRMVERGGRSFPVMAYVTETVDETLSRYAVQISRVAAELATGERSPDYREETLPGKRIPLTGRLAPEMASLVERSDGCVRLDELLENCPTAAALPGEAARRGLLDAAPLLPDRYCMLAGRYVTDRSAVLAGVAFAHVITFEDWHQGRLLREGGLEHLLRLSGHPGPFRVQVGKESCPALERLFALLQPEVGDELHVSFADPAAGLLSAHLTRREQRDPAERLAVDREAAGVICRHIAETQRRTVAEWEGVEVLLAEGFYREGRCPDPVWLLAAPAVGSGLFWRGDRALTSESWWGLAPTFGRNPYGYWPDRQNVLNQFTATLFEPGQTRKGIETALAVVDAWCRHWPADQSVAAHPPALAALLNFLWNVAPLEMRRLRVAPDSASDVLARWFRFLGTGKKSLQTALREHVAACSLTEAYLSRVRTAPAGRADAASMAAWLMEGYRWIGADLCFGRGAEY